MHRDKAIKLTLVSVGLIPQMGCQPATQDVEAADGDLAGSTDPVVAGLSVPAAKVVFKRFIPAHTETRVVDPSPWAATPSLPSLGTAPAPVAVTTHHLPDQYVLTLKDERADRTDETTGDVVVGEGGVLASTGRRDKGMGRPHNHDRWESLMAGNRKSRITSDPPAAVANLPTPGPSPSTVQSEHDRAMVSHAVACLDNLLPAFGVKPFPLENWQEQSDDRRPIMDDVPVAAREAAIDAVVAAGRYLAVAWERERAGLLARRTE